MNTAPAAPATPSAGRAARSARLRRIRLLIRKEFLQLRRDPMLLRLLFIMPIAQLVMMGYVVAADVTHLSTAVVDLDRSSISRQVEARFDASGYFDITEHPASEADLRPLMDSGRIGVAVVIPEGTSAALARGEQAPIGIVVDGTDAQTASVGSGYASRLVMRLNEDLVAGSGAPGTAARAPGVAGGSDTSLPGLDTRVQVLYNPEMTTLTTMIPSLMAVIITISVLVVLSQAIVREKEQGTLEQMFTTPIRPTEYLIGKVVPYLLLATAQMIVVALVGKLWFKVPFNGSMLVGLSGLALIMLVSVGLGLLVSLVSHTRAQAIQAVLFVLLPSMILSGFVFPISSMPELIQPLCQLVPLTHAIEIVRGVAVTGAGFTDLGTQFAALIGFTVIVFGGAVLATRRRLTE